MPRKPKAPSSPKYKSRVGYEGEYYLVHKFVDKNKRGSYAIRTPGSGAGKVPKPDLIAVDNGELMAIEVKSTRKNYVMINKSQVERLTSFCRNFVVECPHCKERFAPKPVLAARFLGRGWKFAEVPMDLEKSLIIRHEKRKGNP